MATAGDQIKRAMRLLGVLAGGETPSATEYADGVVSLNQMLDSWSTERLVLFSSTTQTFTWPAGQASRTLGASGNFVGTRPVTLETSTNYTYQGITYTPSIINRDQYNAIPDKTIQTQVPEVLYVNMTYPNLTMYLYPVPSANLTFNIIGMTPMTQVADETTVLSLPDGYLRALAYNLAVEMAPEYGVEPSRTVKNIARISRMNIKRINNPDDVLSVPVAIINNGRYNIVTDGY